MKARVLSVGVALALATATPAAAQTASDNEGISAGNVRRVLRDLGYPVTIDMDSSDEPRVTTSVDGHKWQIYFYDCSKGALEERRCVSFQFFVDNWFPKPVSSALINKWNREYRYAKAYIQQGNEAGCPEERGCAARIEIDVLITGTEADPERTFRAYFEVIRRRAAGFRNYMTALP